MWKHFRNDIVMKSRLRNYDLETNYQQSSLNNPLNTKMSPSVFFSEAVFVYSVILYSLCCGTFPCICKINAIT